MQGSVEVEREALLQAIGRFVQSRSAGSCLLWQGSQPRDDFEALALRLLRYQVRANPIYRRYCLQQGFDAEQATEAMRCPALPTEVFKRQAVCCFDPSQARACFVSSGSTLGDRGRHYFRSLELMEAAYEGPFRSALLPERARMRMLLLAPRAEESPQSSLYHMLELLCLRHGSAGSEHVVRANGQLDTLRARSALLLAEQQSEPLLIMGPAFAFVHLLDSLEHSFALPAGSRILETGGYKGKSRELSRTDFHAQLCQRWGVAPAMVVGEYGMSELSSQLYERTLSLCLAGQSGGRAYAWPAWCVPQVLDPQSLEPVAEGQLGQIALFDLANVDSVAHVLTGDLGRMSAEGLLLEGRSPNATPKGCSLSFEQRLEGNAAASDSGEP